MRWNTILVPHDFSPPANRALALAAELGELHRARLVLLHVTALHPMLGVDMLIETTAGQATLGAYLTGETRRLLEKLAEPLRRAGIATETATSFGEAAVNILGEATRRGADLIVMGTHGRRGVSHLLLGSVAEKVVRAADVPVLTVGGCQGAGAEPAAQR